VAGCAVTALIDGMRWLPNEPVIGSKTGVFPSCNTTPYDGITELPEMSDGITELPGIVSCESSAACPSRLSVTFRSQCVF
jgi:hypothetical protein